MESPLTTERITSTGHLAAGIVIKDLEDMDTPPSCYKPDSQQKRKRNEVVLDVAAINGDNYPLKLRANGGSPIEKKDKQPMKFFQNLASQDLITSSSFHSSGYDASVDLYRGIAVDGEFSNNLNSDDYDEDYEEDEAEYDYDMDDFDNDNQFNLAAQFDDLDLPPGVEATVPWLQKLAPVESNNNKQVLDVKKEKLVKLFKRFDTVEDHSDHYFTQPETVKKLGLTNQPSKEWAKQIQHEWKVLEKDLPDRIFVRVYEERLDLLRAVIVGPAGTPYHDGLFFFDVLFPSTYPSVPPLVHYHSGGLRLNPNLYVCGKVCLSLLGTWSGKGCETWRPEKSTMLQVLVSIQALVLNEKPYFNEPGYAESAGTYYGEEQCSAYNKEVFLLSCKTMIYSLRRPPKNFEDFVAAHFCESGHIILRACKAYINGAQVGSTLETKKDEDGDKRKTGTYGSDQGRCDESFHFSTSLKVLYEELLMEFTVKGAECHEFLVEKAMSGASRRPEATLWL